MISVHTCCLSHHGRGTGCMEHPPGGSGTDNGRLWAPVWSAALERSRRGDIGISSRYVYPWCRPSCFGSICLVLRSLHLPAPEDVSLHMWITETLWKTKLYEKLKEVFLFPPAKQKYQEVSDNRKIWTRCSAHAVQSDVQRRQQRLRRVGTMCDLHKAPSGAPPA